MEEDEAIDLNILKIAISISIIIGVFVMIGMIITNNPQSERFSALYLVPDSYTNFPDQQTIHFTYGVKSYERGLTEYELDIYIEDRLVEKRKISLKPEEIYEENISLLLPEKGNITNNKIRLILTSPFSNYSTHFWIKEPP